MFVPPADPAKGFPNRIGDVYFRCFDDGSMSVSERFKTCGVVARAARTGQGTFTMAIRDAGLQCGASPKTITEWRETLPNKYLGIGKTGRKMAPSLDGETGELFTAATSGWSVYGIPGLAVKRSGYLQESIDEFYAWLRDSSLKVPRLSPSHPSWANQAHSEWFIWSTLAIHGPMSVTELGNHTGLGRTTVSKVKKRLCENGLVFPDEEGRTTTCYPLNPERAEYDGMDEDFLHERLMRANRERKDYWIGRYPRA